MLADIARESGGNIERASTGDPGKAVNSRTPAAERKRLAAAKLETFRVNGLMEAASEQSVGTKMGTEARIN